MALDLDALWDFMQPAHSEVRFRAALADADADTALILRTQIARSFGMRQDFATARALLREIEPALASASAEARVRHALEWGRCHASATHDSAQIQADEARAAFQRALDLARAAGLDGLAIDAIHMFAFVDREPAEQLRRADEGLALALRSPQAAARRWQAPLRHNRGLALHRLGRRDEALTEFEQARELRRELGDAPRLAVARWMVAWTLRTLGREEQALREQLALARDNEAAGRPDPYVFEELETLYRARGEPERAAHYAERRQAAAKTP